MSLKGSIKPNVIVFSAFILVLAIGFFVLGYSIYKPGWLTSGKPEQADFSQLTDTNSDNSQKVFIYPKNGSEQEKRDFKTLVKSLAVKSDAISISGCKASPEVLQSSVLGKITINNRDEQKHTIAFGKNKYLVEAGASRLISLEFAKTGGYYYYTCDGEPRPIGLLYVE